MCKIDGLTLFREITIKNFEVSLQRNFINNNNKQIIPSIQNFN